MKRLIMFAALAVAAVTVVGSAAAGNGTKSSVIYNSVVPNGPPSNLPSEAFEAQSVSQFGAAVTFTGSARNLTSVTVGMSSFACVTGSWDGSSGACSTPTGATFSQPITLNIYQADGSTLITSVTQTFAIPYRPSSSPKCLATDPNRPYGWYSPGLKQCFNGMTDNVTFNISGVTLPNSIVYGIVYNTSNYGPNPVGVTGPYDSLNVALSTDGTSGSVNDVTAGSTGSIWLNSAWSGAYQDGGATGTFRADSGSWSPYVPAVQFKASNSS
jgi:hypothetical protein